MEPSYVYYWKNNRWVRVKRVFTTEEEVCEWYRRNRWRVDGLTVCKPIRDPQQKTLEG